jgi:hypothetical protein
MRHLGSLRLYESAIREMAARGHHVHLSLGRADASGWTAPLESLAAEYPSITWSWLSPAASAFWSEVATTVRLWADYLRYFEPEYASTPKLKARVAERMPPRLLRFTHHPVVQRPANRRRLRSALRAIERSLPAAAEIEQQLRAERPDVVLVTPLVYVGLGTSQFELLRTALALGLRTAYCVGSWDHLSSKALIRELPHRVFAWNETQRDELVRLHGVPGERVVVTGAQCYDQWFGRQPSRSREEFCRRVGLAADRPLILYVCSALFQGSPSEAAFVREWVARLRASDHPVLRTASVLVRPHPQRLEEWQTADLASLGDVTLWGGNPVTEDARADYFDSLYHSAAVVGLNTSAFLEGAIVGRPVHTILLPEFQENQEGTLHFHYLLTVGGGVLQAARSVEEHHAWLAGSLAGQCDRPGTAGDRPGTTFVREFIRPRGLNEPATPVFCDAVDDLARMPAPAPAQAPVAAALLRWSMYPILRGLHRVYGAELFRDDWSRRAREEDERRQTKVRARRAREQAAETARRERAERRKQKLAARDAASAAERADRERAIADKVRRQRAKERDRASRVRQRSRATGRARIKQGVKAWVTAWRLRRQGEGT